MEGTDPAEVAARVRAAAPRLGTVRLVTVDGPAGSGKTTFATALSRLLGGAPVVHMDDLYEGWDGLDASVLARLEAWVLAPLRAGRPGRYRRFDWHEGEFAEWHEVPLTDVLVVEGVGAGAAPVAGAAVVRVWVEAPPELRLRRGLERDGEGMREQWLTWSAREDAHFAADGTRDRADVVVDGGR